MTRTILEGVRKWIQNQAHIQEAKKWDFAVIYHTWARSDVSEMDPILGAVWRPVLHKTRKNEEVEDTQKLVQKKGHPLQI